MTKRTVFDPLERFDKSPARNSEPTAEFLNRVAGEYWDQVRSLIEIWASAYPGDAHADLIGRLRSPLNRHWGSAFWELYLYRSLIAAHYDVKVHPPGASTRRPDFLAIGERDSFYVEAKSFFGGEPRSSDARLSIVIDELNQVHSPNFFVAIAVRSIGPRALATRKLRNDLETWLGALDPDLPPQAWLDPAGEKHRIVNEGWDLTFRPLPVGADARSRGHRPVATWNFDNGPAASSATLRTALRDKGGAYGPLPHPLLLAFNLDSGFDRTRQVTSALFGEEEITFNASSLNSQDETQRSGGYWIGHEGWHHRHVAGVLIGTNVKPSSVAVNAPTLWLHPSPDRPLLGPSQWHRAELSGSAIQIDPAKTSPAAPFGLAPDWPLGRPFPQN